jgi:exodeoxyribonuclease V gamma subunit
MSTLYLGTDQESLAEKLATAIDEAARSGDFFTPVTVVAPNRYLAKWLRLWLARRLGVAINLKVEFRLEQFMWEMLKGLDGREHPVPLELLDESQYRLMILAELLQEEAPGTALAPLREYLGEQDDERRRDYWRRAWHLAGQLAGLLRDYEYHRQDILIQSWLKNPPEDGYPQASERDLHLERGQRELFLRITREPGGLRARLSQAVGKLCKTLPQYANEIMELLDMQLRSAHATYHLFGLSQISELHANTLHWLGRRHDLRLYYLSPLVGHLKPFLPGPGPAHEALCELADRLRGSDKDRDTRAHDNELLAAWGCAGAESLRVMARLLKHEEMLPGQRKRSRRVVAPFQVEVVPPQARTRPGTVLGRVQDDLAGRAAGTELLPQDTTVQMVACPGIYREVETLHNSILHSLHQDASLKQTDIAVLVTDMARYRPVIQAVFERSPRRVLYNLADYSAAELSTFGHGVMGLLDLAQESFSRSRVFAVILNPCFLARLGVDRDQALVWLEWAESLGIYHGWDRQDKRARGYADSPLYGWQLGLRRLRLGRLMAVADEAAGAAAPCYRGVIPFATLESGDRELLDAFCRAVEGLLPRLLQLRGLRTTGEAWAAALRELVDDFLAAPADRPAEAQVRAKLFQSLERLKLLDALASPPPARGKGESATGLPLALVREFVQESLETLKAMTGEFLTGGVTISALQPLLPVPFRIVYVLGLGEGLFPGSNNLSALDLRSRKRLPGDIRPAETNRYLFLQALLAARDKVYLLYNSRELQKDQLLHPCSPLNQLRRYLEENVLQEKKLRIADLPLLGSDPRCLTQDAGARTFDVFSTYTETDRLLAIDEAMASGDLRLDARQADQVQRRLRDARPDFQLPVGEAVSATNADGANTPTVTLSELRGFLRCPAEAALKRHLHLVDEDQVELTDDEPFYTGFPYNYRLVTETLNRFVDQAVHTSVDEALQDWRPAFRALHQEWRLRGRAPEDAFAEVDLDAFEETLENRFENPGALASFLRARAGAELHGPMLLGESFVPIEARRRFPALQLRLGNDDISPLLLKARLVGMLPRIWSSADALDILVVSNTSSKKVPENHLSALLLEPVLFVLAMKAGTEPGPDGLSSQAWMGDRAVRIHVVHDEGMVCHTYGPEDTSPEEAEVYLAELVRDFLARGSFDLLPFELVVADGLRDAYLPEADRKEPALTPEAYFEKLQDAVAEDEEALYPKYRPMKLLEVVRPEIPRDAYHKVLRRFQLLDRGPARGRPRGEGEGRARGR